MLAPDESLWVCRQSADGRMDGRGQLDKQEVQNIWGSTTAVRQLKLFWVPVDLYFRY